MITIVPPVLDVILDWLSVGYTVLKILGSVAGFLGTAYALYLWGRGILPVLIRLGNGLARRTIVVFASESNAASLESLFLDSRLLRKKNIRRISGTADIGRAEGATLFVVYWPDWSEHIEKIIAKKADKCALIIYAPPDAGQISKEVYMRLNNERNTIVVNMRGRLMNDIITSMITTV